MGKNTRCLKSIAILLAFVFVFACCKLLIQIQEQKANEDEVQQAGYRGLVIPNIEIYPWVQWWQNA